MKLTFQSYFSCYWNGTSQALCCDLYKIYIPGNEWQPHELLKSPILLMLLMESGKAECYHQFYLMYILTNCYKDWNRMALVAIYVQFSWGLCVMLVDLSLLCPTTRGIQKMISVCSEFAEEYNIFDTNKTVCMTFGNRPICPVVYLYLNGESLNGLTTSSILEIS